MAAQGGANVIYGAGMIEMGMTFDLAQLIIDSEIYKMVLHTINGFKVNEETLALDVIKEVKMGEFVSQKHTTDNFKKIQSHSEIINRQPREQWLAAGGRDILENHKPEPLTEEQAAYIRKVVEDAEAEYGVK